MLNDPIVIVSAARTPMGAFQGELKDFAAPQLGAAAIRAAIARAGSTPKCPATAPAMNASSWSVGFRSRPSNKAAACNPGQSASTRPPRTAPPSSC